MSEQRVALVTGASRGIGRAIAMALGQRNIIVAGTATSESGAAQLTADFAAAGVQGAGFVLKLGEMDSITACHEAVSSAPGSPAILVNNAGITRDGLFLRMKPEQWEEVIHTNLTGVFHLTKACIRAMLKARWGRIVSISSVVGIMGNPGQANYCASKAGVIGFTKSIAHEFATKGITANAVAPGFIATDMTAELTEQQAAAIQQQIPMGRMGEAEDIAQAVAFLASDNAAYITGQTLNVNGGMCMV